MIRVARIAGACAPLGRPPTCIALNDLDPAMPNECARLPTEYRRGADMLIDREHAAAHKEACGSITGGCLASASGVGSRTSGGLTTTCMRLRSGPTCFTYTATS